MLVILIVELDTMTNLYDLITVVSSCKDCLGRISNLKYEILTVRSVGSLSCNTHCITGVKSLLSYNLLCCAHSLLEEPGRRDGLILEHLLILRNELSACMIFTECTLEQRCTSLECHSGIL